MDKNIYRKKRHEFTYTDSEVSRIYECIFFIYLDELSPNWAINSNTENYLKVMVDIYNSDNKDKIDFKNIQSVFHKIKKIVNRFSTYEVIHTLYYFGQGYRQIKNNKYILGGYDKNILDNSSIRMTKRVETIQKMLVSDKHIMQEADVNMDLRKFMIDILYRNINILGSTFGIMNFQTGGFIRLIATMPQEIYDGDIELQIDWVVEQSIKENPYYYYLFNNDAISFKREKIRRHLKNKIYFARKSNALRRFKKKYKTRGFI